MESAAENKDYYQLSDMYKVSKITGKNCSMTLRDNSDHIHGIIDVCNDKISKVGGYKGDKLSDPGRKELIKFVRTNNLSLTQSAAKDLGLSIYYPTKGGEVYLDERGVDNLLKEDISGINLVVHKYKKRVMRVKSSTKGAILNLSRAAIKTLIIEKNCNLVIDLRDNPYIEALIIKDSFAGNINLSRNAIRKIDIANNSRCELSINDSMKCFDLSIADVFSGILNVKNSCFHDLDIGYYCYASIKLESNWGKRNIKVGNSFRGDLEIDSVLVPNIHIGDDCKGNVTVSSKDEAHGSKHLEVEDEFSGHLDLSNSKTITNLEFGNNTRGQINLLGCPSIKVARFGEHYNGKTDFSNSGIEYLHAKKDCRGGFLMLNCDNLALIKMPNERKTAFTIEREPISIKSDNENIYYKYHHRELPREYFVPFYKECYKGVKRFFKERIKV